MLTLPGPAAKGNSVIQPHQLLHPPPTHRQNTHTFTEGNVQPFIGSQGRTKDRGEEGDDEDIDMRSESLRKLARATSIWAFFSFVFAKLIVSN